MESSKRTESTTWVVILLLGLSALTMACMTRWARWNRSWERRSDAIVTLQTYGIELVQRTPLSKQWIFGTNVKPDESTRVWIVGVPRRAQYVETTKILPYLKELSYQGNLDILMIFVSRHEPKPTPVQLDIPLLRRQLPRVAVVEWVD